MYGLLLENMVEYIKETYGKDKWDKICADVGIQHVSFSTHEVYGENIIPNLATKAIEILNVTEQHFFYQMGVYFISFVRPYGYDRVLLVLGRHMRDFLNGLDNLHEYLKFSYPKMRAPSFICENETSQGLTLHYRSKRKGFVYYTMGQIKEMLEVFQQNRLTLKLEKCRFFQRYIKDLRREITVKAGTQKVLDMTESQTIKEVARYFYHKEMKIELIKEELLFDMIHTTFQLTFDNRAFTLTSLAMTTEEKHLPISASILFEIFPFCVVFSSEMVVKNAGNSLVALVPDIVGKRLTNWFDLVRPLITFNFQTIMNRTNNVFELVSIEPVLNNKIFDGINREISLIYETQVENDKNLRLKGQMIYMENWKAMMYLGTPVMPDLNSLIYSGLYINDLSMHDFSRDLMLAGTQQSVELKLALDQEQQKSKKLEESMRRLDEEMKRTDELLYQMIPKQVADRLRAGENPINTCEMFESVSILFSDVVTFTEICSRITPMQVVSVLNNMYSIFDHLSEQNKVYKVETIGDAYMVVSGAPQRENDHAERVCKMALDMVAAITSLKDPSTGKHLEVRVGIHSGTVVAGVVGVKMPRYCLFGDSVNIAAKMESTSKPMKIHISQPTKDLLPSSYHVTAYDQIYTKEKGSIKTYWLELKNSRPQKYKIPLRNTNDIPEYGRSAALGKKMSTYAPIMYCDFIPEYAQSTDSNGECHSRVTGAKYMGRNPADLFGLEINNSLPSSYNNQLPTTKSKPSQKDDNTSEAYTLLLNHPSNICSITNGSTTTSAKPTKSNQLVKPLQVQVNTANSNQGKNFQLSEKPACNRNHPLDSQFNRCCTRFSLNHKHTFQATACSIT